MRWLPTVFVAAVGAAGAVLAVGEGCSSSSFTAPPSSDGGARETGADGGVDSAPAEAGADVFQCVLPPQATGSDGMFCQGLADYFNRCRNCQPCYQEDLNNCVRIGTGMSDALKNAFVACQSQLPCGMDYVKAATTSPCVLQAALGTPPTTAQRQAETAYCAACPDDPDAGRSTCTNYFAFDSDAAGAGLGAVVRLASDQVASDIAMNCTPGACGPLADLAYGGCNLMQLCGVTGSTACMMGLCK